MDPAIVDPAISWILRAGLAALMAIAAIHKSSDFGSFVQTLRDYRVLPEALAGWAAALVVALEVSLALALLVPAFASLAALACASLLAVYSAAIAANLARGRRHIDCGCMGPSARQPLSGGLLARNAALIAACGLAALPAAARALTWVDSVSIAGGVLVVSLLFHATNTLMAGSRALGRPL